MIRQKIVLYVTKKALKEINDALSVFDVARHLYQTIGKSSRVLFYQERIDEFEKNEEVYKKIYKQAKEDKKYCKLMCNWKEYIKPTYDMIDYLKHAIMVSNNETNQDFYHW